MAADENRRRVDIVNADGQIRSERRVPRLCSALGVGDSIVDAVQVFGEEERSCEDP